MFLRPRIAPPRIAPVLSHTLPLAQALRLGACTILGLTALGATPALAQATPALAQATPTSAAVVAHYADMAEAGYGDSLMAARALQKAVAALVAAPSVETLAQARSAWRAARVPYMQTEVFRFGNPIVDEWEGKVNAWPLDEGLIDYVDASYAEIEGENALRQADVIANPQLEIAGATIDASTITPELIADVLHEADETEANVASGYHAVEFLLWGQDLNGTGPGAGDRPFSDYLQDGGCTNGNCDRRAAYLTAVTQLLVDDLAYMAAAWAPDGAARAAVIDHGTAEVAVILKGMGSLSYGELAGERMKLGLMLNDPEEEQDCFSDNTQFSHYYDGVGIRNVYLGQYQRLDGSQIAGPALADLIAASNPGLDGEIRAALDLSVERLGAIVAATEQGMAYDMMLAPGNTDGAALITAAVEALVAQTGSIERAVTALGATDVEFEGSDSLDNPGAVLQ